MSELPNVMILFILYFKDSCILIKVKETTVFLYGNFELMHVTMVKIV